MPDDKKVGSVDKNAERIRKWQEDRKRLAKQENGSPTVESKDQSIQDVIATQIPMASSATHLLPTASDLIATKTRLRKLQRRSKSITAFQFLATCLIPWIGAAYYLTAIATPLYEARSVISVSSPSSVTETNQNGILGSLGGPSNMQDVFMAHAYIQSLAMMEELESESSVISELSGPMLDPIQRLRDMPSLSLDKHRQFSRFVDSAVDIQTGLITLYVRLPQQSEAIAVSEAVLTKVSDQVSKLNTGVIAQRLSLANDAASQAQDKVAKAHADLLKVQIDSGEADPAERIASLYAQISLLETEVTALNKEIQKCY